MCFVILFLRRILIAFIFHGGVLKALNSFLHFFFGYKHLLNNIRMKQIFVELENGTLVGFLPSFHITPLSVKRNSSVICKSYRFLRLVVLLLPDTLCFLILRVVKVLVTFSFLASFFPFLASFFPMRQLQLC